MVGGWIVRADGMRMRRLAMIFSSVLRGDHLVSFRLNRRHAPADSQLLRPYT